MKVFKFKKYKDGYDDEEQGAVPKYLLEVDAFESQGLRHLAERGTSPVKKRIALSGSVVPMAMGFLLVLPPPRLELPRVFQPDCCSLDDGSPL